MNKLIRLFFIFFCFILRALALSLLLIPFASNGQTIRNVGNGISNTSGTGISSPRLENASGIFSNTGTLNLSNGLVLTGDTFYLNDANVINNATSVVLNGGILCTGITTGYSETLSTLNITENSFIVLGSGAHDLNFAASNGVAWTADKTLVIKGWQGAYNGTSGTAGKIFIGTDATGLNAGQLSNIIFSTGTNYYRAIQLATGEVVPSTIFSFTSVTDGNWNNPVTWGYAPGLPVPYINVPGAFGNTTISLGNTVTISSNTIADNIIVTGVLAIGNSNLTAKNLSGTGSVSINTGALTINENISTSTINFTGAGTINIEGNFTPTSLTSTLGTINCNGAAQTFSGVTYHNLTINGAGIKTLSGSASIGGNLTLTSGIIQLGNNDLTITNTSNTAISGTYSNTSMIQTNGTGSLIKQGNATSDFLLIYPVGSGNFYAPMELAGLSGTVTSPGSVHVRTVATAPAGLPSTNILNRYWVTSSTNIASIVANIKFTYNSSDLPVSATASEIFPFYNPGTSWVVPDGANTTGQNPFYSSAATTINASWTAAKKAIFYSLVNGNWDDWETWTYDPSGSLPNNPDHLTPSSSLTASSDEVVILSGKTVTIQPGNNNKSNAKLTLFGNLNVTTTTGHNFTYIDGTGRMYLGADNLPNGDASNFLANGTIVLSGVSHTMTIPRTFNNVEVNTTNTTDIVSLAANYNINGTLTIVKGTLQLNDNASTTPLNFLIKGTTTIDAGASFTVGTGHATHKIEFQGDVTNNGTIDFANNAQYACESTGAVKAYFKGSQDNILLCNGTTDLYRMFVDKGSDDAYTLSVISTNNAYFNLFGPIDGATCIDPDDGPGGWERLALVLVHGTLKLGSNIRIQRLGGNRTGNASNEFNIPSGTKLWINGADVSTYDAGGVSRGITIYGTLQVSSGFLRIPDNSGGIDYFANAGTNGKLILEGGSIYTTQINKNGSGGSFTYVQTGGSLYINNLSNNRGSSAVFALPASDFVFIMSGGLIQIDAVNTTTTNGIDIECDPTNVNVSGGTFEVRTPTYDAATYPNFHIKSTAPFYNLTLTNFGSRPGSQSVLMQSDLTILNDLNIGASTTLNTAGFNLNVSHNMTVDGTYTPGSNTTTFEGSTNATFTVNGTINPRLNNLTIDKGSNSLTLAGSGTFAVANNLNILSGTLADGGITLTVNGNIANSATHTSTGTGKIVMSGGSAQHTLSGDGNGQFGNLELNDANGAVITCDQQINGTLTMTNGILDIGINKLTVTSISPNNISGYSATKMIRMSGNDSDDGLVRPVSTTGSVYFPIGTNSGGTNRYTPSIINISALTTSGAMQMNVGDNVLPSLNSPSGTNELTYYWKVRRNGAVGTATYQFTASQFDDYDATPGFTGSDRKGFVMNESPYTRYNDGGGLSGILTFTVDNAGAGYPIYNASYTVAKVNNFTGTPDVFYTNGNRTDGAFANVNWNNGATWHQGSKTGGTGTVPTIGSIVVIYSDDLSIPRVWADAIPNEPAEIDFEQNISPSNTENIPRLQFNTAGTFNLGTVKGTGMISFNAGLAITANGDFGDFGANPGSYYLYFGGSATLTNIPSPIPNIMFEGGIANPKSINQSITVNNDFIIQGQTTITPLRNITIKRDLVLGYWEGGTLNIPAAPASALTITIERNIDYTQIFDGNGIRNLTVENAASAFEHKIILKGNILHGDRSTDLLTLFNSAASTRAILELQGSGNNYYSRGPASTSVPALYRLIINKGSDQTSTFTFNQHFTLGGTSNTATKALQLSNGSLILNNASFNLPLTTGGAAFNIPSTAKLELQSGTLTASGGSGITLDGTLTISGGTVDMSGAVGENNYIEYTASGNANLNISGGNLIVGSQIRRSQYVNEGSLKYNQTGGNVTVGRRAAPVSNRGVFEVLNTGSSFTFTGGTLSISRAQTTPSIASLYLNPELSNIGTGTTINIGDANTPASQTIGIYSAVPLQTININSTNSPSARLWTGALTLDGNLNINASATFDANGMDLILKGNLTKNATGTFTASSNNTYFSGSTTQTITGDITFYNLTKEGSNNLSLASGSSTINVLNNLDIQSGTITDNSNNIYVKGTCNIDGTHIYGGSGNGITLNGSSPQTLTGDGILGKLTVNNANNIVIPLNNTLTINNALRLQNGVLDIGKNLLTFNVGAVIEPGTYSASNMIQTYVSFTDFGVKKIFPNTGLPYTFTYPLGSGGKYTPVNFYVTNNGNNTGAITVKAADEMHPSIIEDSETPEIVDADNVLQYYWVLRSNGITGFAATADMTYDPYDVKVTTPYTVRDYITARLKNDGSGEWNKFTDVNTFDETNRWARFNFTTGTDDISISGDYTAGIDHAIPNLIPLYETTTSGIWTVDDIWSPSISGGPRGSLTRINAGHTVTVSSNYLLDYTTEINGTVLLNNTFGHRFGDVSGTGTIYLERDALPAGSYDQFFSSAGGTLEYGGTTDYDILAGIAMVNNLRLSGTGKRNFPNDNFILNGTLNINGADVHAYTGKEINIKGNLIRSAGTFNAGTGTSSILFSSTVNQTITGDFTGTSSLNILKINNPNGLTLAGNVRVNSKVILTNGTITTGANSLTLGLTGTITPSPGTLTSYINGKLVKELTSGTNFIYPVGKNGNLGPIEVLGTSGFSGTGNWAVEYFTGYDAVNRNPASMEAGLQYVSHFEYWSVQAPAGGTGKLKITLDGSSDIANAVSDLADIRITGWNGSQWVIIGGVPTITGTKTSGYVTSSSAINFDSYQYITLASTTPITTKTATITSGDANICSGGSSDILVFFTGASPWVFDYMIDGTLQTAINTTSNPYTINTGTLTTGATPTSITYTLNSITGGTIVGDVDARITVNPIPTVTLSSSDADNSFCAGTSVTFTANTGLSNYHFYDGATSLLDGSVRTYTSTTLANLSSITVVGTNTYGCSATSSPAIVNNVGTMPTAPSGTGATRCGTGTVNLTATGAGAGESYHWYSVYSGGIPQGTGATFATPSISANTNFYLTKYNTTSNCESTPRVTVTATVVAQPTSPTLTPSPNLASVCEGLTLTATATAGTGGAGTITDEYSNDGITWNTTIPSFSSTVGTNYIESRRRADGTGCVTSTPNQVSWIVNAQPVASTLNKNPNTAAVAEGVNVSATLNVLGSGGTGCNNIYEYRTDGGAWNSYNLGDPIGTSGLTSVDIRSTRGGCTASAGCTDATSVISWTVSPLPDDAGPITGVTPVCQGDNNVNFSVSAITNATSYTWEYTGTGATISGTTQSITINFSNSATSGDLTVKGTNAFGDGNPSPVFSITVNNKPAAGPLYRLPNK